LEPGCLKIPPQRFWCLKQAAQVTMLPIPSVSNPLSSPLQRLFSRSPCSDTLSPPFLCLKGHPGLAYYQGLVGGTHDWQWKSVPQGNANNREMNWPGGKMLGGSSALNGCYLVRPSAIEVEAWHDLINGMDGADNWTADKFFAAMDKVRFRYPPLLNLVLLVPCKTHKLTINFKCG
jgi:choline dehydrogenase-like flavoprotein